MPDVIHKRGTRASFNTLVQNSQLIPWQIYLITDEQRLFFATGVNTFTRLPNILDIPSGGQQQVYIQPTPPTMGWPYIWSQTGINGSDFTIWFNESGT